MGRSLDGRAEGRRRYARLYCCCMMGTLGTLGTGVCELPLLLVWRCGYAMMGSVLCGGWVMDGCGVRPGAWRLLLMLAQDPGPGRVENRVVRSRHCRVRKWVDRIKARRHEQLAEARVSGCGRSTQPAPVQVRSAIARYGPPPTIAESSVFLLLTFHTKTAAMFTGLVSLLTLIPS